MIVLSMAQTCSRSSECFVFIQKETWIEDLNAFSETKMVNSHKCVKKAAFECPTNLRAMIMAKSLFLWLFSKEKIVISIYRENRNHIFQSVICSD